MLSKKIRVAAFFLLLVFVPAATFLLPKSGFSELENRELASPPELNWPSVLDKSFMEDAETFLADQIVFRSQFARAKTQFELLEGRRELDGVLVGKNRLMQNIAAPNEKYTANNAAAINQFSKKYHGRLETTVMLVPTAVEFYPGEVPLAAPTVDQTAYIQDFYSRLERVNTVDAYSPLDAETSNYIFYRTDHHWTSYGAYIGYTALAKTLGYKAATADNFNVEHAAHDFLGTLYSKTLTGETWKDTVDLYSYAKGNVVTDVIKYGAKNNVNYSSIFFRDYLEKKDKYMVFLGGNDGIIQIKTNVKSGKNLIVFRDSYANSLMQFLPLHYDEIVLVNLRAFNGELSDYINVRDYQQALFIYNVGNFTDDNSISKVEGY